MLQNSDLSKKIAKVSDDEVLFFLDEKEKKNKELFKETKERMKWSRKEAAERNKVQNLFSPDITNFFLESKDIRISFDYNETLDPMTMRITQAKMAQEEIKVNNSTHYKIVPHYNTHIIRGKEVIPVGTEKTFRMNQRLEELLTRKSETPISQIQSFNLEADRMTVSIHPSVDKNAVSLETFENLIRKRYTKEMRSLELKQEDNIAISRGGSSINARFAAGTRKPIRRDIH